MNLEEILTGEMKRLGLTISPEQIAQFMKYKDLLLEWNEKMNLTAITEEKSVMIRHFGDSVTASKAMNMQEGEGTTVIDVGTGAGFPGIPLKIMFPQLKVLLLDSTQKRVTFLQTVISELGLTNIEAVHSRAEDGARKAEWRDGFDYAVSRAVARLPVLLEYCLPFVKVGGKLIALKGSAALEEVGEAKTSGMLALLGGNKDKLDIIPYSLWDGDEEFHLHIIGVQKMKKTPKTYPRTAAAMAKEKKSKN